MPASPFHFRAPLAALAAAAWLAAAGPTARAADPAPADTALGKVPDDAEAYSATLRLGETFDLIGRTRVWTRTWNDPAVKALRDQATAAYKNDEKWAPARDFFEDPANKDLPALAADAFSNETFTYAGGGWSDLLGVLQEVIGATRYGPAIQQLNGDAPGGPEEKMNAQAGMALRALADKPQRIKVPELIIGFKVSDPVKVAAQLKRLDPLVADALAREPKTGSSERVKVGGDDFLVVKADGSLIPWEDIDLSKFEAKKGEFKPLVNHLKSLKITLSIGVRQGYLLIVIADSADKVKRFGGDAPALAGRDEFKPLARNSGKPLTGVSYVSAAFLGGLTTKSEDVTGMADLAKMALEKAGLPDDDRKAIEKDVQELAKGFAKDIRKPGATTAFSFRTPSGWETLTYDYTEPDAAPAKPLTLLNHVGGEPLMAAVWRSGTTVEGYKAFTRWIGVFAGHAEKAAVAKSPEAAEGIKKFREEFLPTIQEMGRVTEKLWLPALADGQEALVIDAKWSSKRWHALQPEAETPLPLPEFALVLGVSDAGKFAEALDGYRVAINTLIGKARDLAPPGQLPPVEIPKPKTESKGGTTFAFYPIPEALGVDPVLQPTGGLSDKVAALALSRGHAERLLAKTPLKAGPGPLADLDRPLDSAFYFNWAGMVDMLVPWADYAARLSGADDKKDQANRAFDILRVFRGYSSATYREGGATITHSEAVFRDVTPMPSDVK